jgi:hypothetical protein
MIKLLSSLLSLLDRLWASWSENKLRQQGRQMAIKEANDEINRQIELGAAAISAPDPERDERLRDRFDRSRTPK